MIKFAVVKMDRLLYVTKPIYILALCLHLTTMRRNTSHSKQFVMDFENYCPLLLTAQIIQMKPNVTIGNTITYTHVVMVFRIVWMKLINIELCSESQELFCNLTNIDDVYHCEFSDIQNDLWDNLCAYLGRVRKKILSFFSLEQTENEDEEEIIERSSDMKRNFRHNFEYHRLHPMSYYCNQTYSNFWLNTFINYCQLPERSTVYQWWMCSR